MKKLYLLLLALCGTEQLCFAQNKITDFGDLHTARLAHFFQPTTVREVQDIVRKNTGPISVAGGRFSQGGHIYTNGGTVIDITKLSDIVSVDPQAKTITVQTGATWRKVQEYIDPYNLSVTVMQSYNNFTVGGSLSVNVHGRYLGYGPIMGTVLAIKIVLADGSLKTASRIENSELFYTAVGGYGAVGVVVEATLQLTDNYPIERKSVLMDISDYPHYFKTSIKPNPQAVMHNADLFPPYYNTVECVTWYKTDKTPTVSDRLQPLRTYTVGNHMKMTIAKRFRMAQKVRPASIASKLHTPTIFWRNYEASYNTNDLFYPKWLSVSLLQEFFIPVDHLVPFLDELRTAFTEHNINVLNISLRHVTANSESLLSWSTKESFAVVIFYDQWRTNSSLRNTDLCMQKLIQAALDHGGTYYLPYKLCATQQQFNQAYPQAPLFWSYKKKYDPTAKFSNEFLKAYFPR